MNLLQMMIYKRCLKSCFLALIAIYCVACTSNAPLIQATLTPLPALTTGQLPGQERWKDGVSSFLFGTNDTQEWSDNNIETNDSFQQLLKSAHFTLMRTFFFDKSLADGHATTDAEIELRLKTIENSGMTCLGVLFNIFNVSFDEHVVTQAGHRCLLYEFGNEPDYNGISVNAYLQQWDTVIPLLRHINPQAKFIGPVVANSLNYIQQFLAGVETSKVFPDAISLHWYPCYEFPKATCLAMASSVKDVVAQVRQITQQTIGKNLPIGVTEWNFDPGNPPPSYGDDKNFIIQFSTQALQSMIQAGVAFACQFDAASYSGYGHLDIFDITTSQPKPQFYAIAAIIAQYRPASSPQ